MMERLSVPEKHQKRIALHTLRLSDSGALILGGMTKAEARAFLMDKCGWTPARVRRHEER